MNSFNELLKENEIPSPKCFVTDRELALLNTLDELFPSSDHILCRWHVNKNVVAKTKRLFKDQENFDKFYDAWNAEVDSESFEIYNSNVSNLQKHKLSAVNSTGDHKQIFGPICLFWEDQHRDISQDIAQYKMKPRHAVKIQLFQDFIGFVHPSALIKILEEKGKLTDALPQACICSIEQIMGLPCFHKIHARQRSSGKIALAYIDPHWYYQRRREQPQLERRILLEPSIVKGKGRSKGSKNKVHQKN
ncbi:hypothetical protein K3495_g14546 [Podosphaera aphanis]|nr:hypothetical protein K3495_g14546 [Podosphaera aphanis]